WCPLEPFEDQRECTSQITSASIANFEDTSCHWWDFIDDLFTVSHGETVAEVFPQWLRLAWKRGHFYHAYDLNMPSLIPNRPMEHFRYDPPLSEHGYLSAEVAGHSIKLAGYEPFQIYSSPELRCVQTASAIIRAFEPTTIQICMEPSLADWVQFTPKDISKQWLIPQQVPLCAFFSQLGYPVNSLYKPYLSEVPTSESPDDYLRRLSRFFNAISEPNKR
ncbi:unnamed protein product, partial [Angiostrongylus costaricensis]|uniref:SAM-dependent methyltransferase n=1 Tax=Angiostrongylus costaricensis TaxID=334426 RepID=A0A0R3PAC8_ANGCS